MIVPKHVVPGILAGSVTTVRLPLSRWTPKQTDLLRTGHFTEGKDSEGNRIITGRHAGQTLCRINVLHHRVVPLEQENTRKDNAAAKRDGYGSHRDWLRVYFDVYGDGVTDTEGWLLEFAIDKSEPIRLLSSQQGARFSEGPVIEDGADEGQYTSSRMRALTDEPEAVDPLVVKDLPATMIAQQRWTKDRADRLRNRQGMTPGELLDAYLVDAKQRHIDVHGPLREIQRQTKRIARKVDPEAA